MNSKLSKHNPKSLSDDIVEQECEESYVYVYDLKQSLKRVIERIKYLEPKRKDSSNPIQSGFLSGLNKSIEILKEEMGDDLV